jgi:hypothetical protein
MFACSHASLWHELEALHACKPPLLQHVCHTGHMLSTCCPHVQHLLLTAYMT